MRIALLFFFIFNFIYSFSQDKLFSNSAVIGFISETPIINIAGENKKVVTFLKPSNGEIAFALRMTDFEFELPLAREHFNENYVESDKYPTSTFKGQISNFESLDIKKEGTYPVLVTGDLLIHGTTINISQKAILTVSADGQIKGYSTFKLRPEDYKIKVPRLVRDKIAEEVTVTISVDYKPYNDGK